jgi:hypothetical protein
MDNKTSKKAQACGSFLKQQAWITSVGWKNW